MKRNKTIFHTIIALLALLTGASSCDSDTILYEYQPIHKTVWNKTDTLTFFIDSVAQSGCYQRELGIRTNAHFPFKNIWIGIKQQLHHPDTILIDTVMCAIQDSTGYHPGQGINLYLHQKVLSPDILQEKQTGIIQIYHLMRQEEIPGITHAGIKLQRTGQPQP